MYEIKRYHFSQISSTNDYAKELIKTEECVAVTADYQWSGRGRSEKVWEGGEAKNVYCSVGIRHASLQNMDALLSWQALGCLAAQRALMDAAPSKRFALKYPNDVMIQTAHGHWVKICGVLVEHEFSGLQCLSTVVGIGINVRQEQFPPHLHGKATSLLLEGIQADREDITRALLQCWLPFASAGAKSIIAQWKRELHIEGKAIEIIGDHANWQAIQLLDDGRLRAQNTTTHAERIIDNGDSIRYDIG